MKRLFLSAMLLAGIAASAQDAKTKTEAPYLKYKDLPAFDAVYMNGNDTFSTYNIPAGKPSIIIYFSPDCDHCKKMFDDLLPRMNELKDVNVYVMTFMPTVAIKIFNNTYHLEKYPAIKFVGQDYKFFFPAFYGVSSVPDVVMYDKNKKFVYLWPDVVTMDDLLGELKKLK